MKKVKKRFNRIEERHIENREIIEKLMSELQYKQNLLEEKKENLTSQEELLNDKKAEMEKRYSHLDKEMCQTLNLELQEYKKTCFREIDIDWQEKMKQIIRRVIMVKE
jgi:hypothetical protein